MTTGKTIPIDYQLGNTKASVNMFFEKLTPAQKQSIKTVNVDMSKAYIGYQDTSAARKDYNRQVSLVKRIKSRYTIGQTSNVQSNGRKGIWNEATLG